MTERLANFATQAANSVLALYRFVFDAFMAPPREAWGILALSISVGCLGIFLNRRWVEAKPNEWLLVIRNGKLVRAGVGLKTFAGLLDTIVTFPSKV